MEEVLLTGNRLLSAFKQGANRVIDLRHNLTRLMFFRLRTVTQEPI